MRRQRQKSQPRLPAALTKYGQVCVSNPRFGICDGKPFCHGVVGADLTASVLFLAKDLESLIKEAKEFHIDGTFKPKPRHAQSNQLLTIIAVQYGIAFSCAFALMSNRTVESYGAVFSAIKKIVPAMSPRLMITEYEAALIRSLETNFPNASKSGYFFHYCQVIMKKAAILGMKTILTGLQKL